MDGRTIYTPLFSGVIWDVQNTMLSDLDRIEVISGPGGYALGGKRGQRRHQHHLKSAKDTQGWYVDAGGGTELQDFGEVRYGGKLAPNVLFLWHLF